MVAITDHPALEQPANREITIWRYMRASHFFWLIEHQRLFMARAVAMRDSREGTIPLGSLEGWEQMIANASGDDLRNRLRDNFERFKQFYLMIRDGAFINCWHLNTDINPRMWDLCTLDGESVAVRSTYERLAHALPDHVFLGKVRYIDYENGELPLPNLLHVVMHKHEDEFKEEAEVRALAVFQMTIDGARNAISNDLYHLEDDNKFFVYAPHVDINQMIVDVVCHPNASDALKERVSNAIEIIKTR